MSAMHRWVFVSSLPCAVWCQCLGGNVFLASYFDEQLEDREGVVGLNGDKGTFQQWRISDATPDGGSGRVVLTSSFGAHLEDREGTVGLHPDRAEFQWWSVQCADDGRVFLTSHLGVQLEDRDGSLGLNGDHGEWQMWTILQDGPLTQCTCDDFPSGPVPPPTPPPTPPAPPAPTPGPLPQIPQKMWFGYWGNHPDDGSYDHSSLVFDNPSDDDIDQHGGPGLRFLYPAFKFFCQEQAESNVCTLYDDYQSRWDAAVPRMQQLLQEQKILGFSIGDERICGCKPGRSSVSDWETMINAIRASFPDRGTAIIHTNECKGTFSNDGCINSVPEGLDWIIFDKYRSDDNSDFFNKYIKDVYKDSVFPKMHDHQKIGLGPQVSYDGNKFGDCSTIAKAELSDAKDSVAWAESDDRIMFITPYAYRDWPKIEGKCDEAKELMDYWVQFGRGTQASVDVMTV